MANLDPVIIKGTPQQFAGFFLDHGNQLAQQIEGLSEACSDLSPKTSDRVWCGVLSSGDVLGMVVEIIGHRLSDNKTLLAVSISIETHPTALVWWQKFRSELPEARKERGYNYETLIKMARAMLIIERKEKAGAKTRQTKICQRAGIDPGTFRQYQRKYRDDPEFRDELDREIEYQRRDKDFMKNILEVEGI